MKYFILLIMLFVCMSCTDDFETGKKTDLEKYDLKGNVKSFRRLPYYAVMNMGYAIKSKPGTDVFQWAEYGLEAVFDEKGRVLEETMYKGDNTIGSTVYYKYDADSLIISSKNKDFIGKCFVQKYNINKDLIEEYELNEDNRLNKKIYLYLLDHRGNKIEEIIIDSEVRIIHRNLCKYNEYDLMIEKQSFINDMIITVNYEYNEQKQLIKEDSFGMFTTYEYDNEGSLIYEINSSGSFSEYKYNERKELIERRQFVSGSSENLKKEYEFDKHGNWIKCVIYVNSKLTSLIEREIDYF